MSHVIVAKSSSEVRTIRVLRHGDAFVAASLAGDMSVLEEKQTTAFASHLTMWWLVCGVVVHNNSNVEKASSWLSTYVVAWS